MRLSESLRRRIMEATAGGIINKFKIKTRRDTLFFEELLSMYILECEKYGFEDKTRKIAEEWGLMGTRILLLKVIKKMPPVFLMNKIIRKVWINAGMMDDLHVQKSGNILHMSMKNEAMTRFIGANNFMTGFYMGIIEALFNSSVQLLEVKQKKKSCTYVFKLYGKSISIDGRPREVYIKLNNIKPIEGYTLRDALKKNILTFESNRIYFRGKFISPVENTVFHIISKFNILPEKMSEVSYEFFKEIVKEKASKDKKLSLLKTLFQIMGWGIIRILIKKKDKILIEIRNPPHGFLLSDNWDYLIRTFLGYLWLVDKRLKISNVKKTRTCILVEYSH